MNKEPNILKFGDELKKNPFSTPQGYFDELPSRIQEKCTKPEPKKRCLRTLMPQLGLVAGIVILIIAANVFFGTASRNSKNMQDGIAQATDTAVYYNENGEIIYEVEAVALDDAIISYLVDNNINDLDIVQ